MNNLIDDFGNLILVVSRDKVRTIIQNLYFILLIGIICILCVPSRYDRRNN